MKAEEIEKGDLFWGVLSYLGILVLLPLFKRKRSDFVSFHLNQGTAMFLLEFCLDIVLGLAALLLQFVSHSLFKTVVIIFGLFLILFTFCRLLGLIHVLRHERKKVPLFGDIQVFKEEADCPLNHEIGD